ncbi:hypothetical protein GCM10027284_46330 [Cyclobacterium sediminis]
MKYPILILVGISLLTGNVYSQDTIIDKKLVEISSKVIEITDNEIKYRKWGNLQGPLYNIPRKEVLMVIYENGQREIFKEIANSDLQKDENILQNGDSSDRQELNLATEPLPDSSFLSDPNRLNQDDMVTTTRGNKVEYKPSRINVGLEPFQLGMDTEIRIIRNAFNMGLGYLYYFPKDLPVFSSQHVNVYGSFYLPVNLLLENYEKQNKGLFPFVHLGYGVNEVTVENDYLGTTERLYSHGFIWKFGFDYLFTNSFGVTLTSYEARNTIFGVVYSF